MEKLSEGVKLGYADIIGAAFNLGIRASGNIN